MVLRFYQLSIYQGSKDYQVVSFMQRIFLLLFEDTKYASGHGRGWGVHTGKENSSVDEDLSSF